MGLRLKTCLATSQDGFAITVSPSIAHAIPLRGSAGGGVASRRWRQRVALQGGRGGRWGRPMHPERPVEEPERGRSESGRLRREAA